MADLNGDGISDLLYADRSGKVSYYHRNANGSLQPKENIIADGNVLNPGQAASVCVTDWNRDGLFDLIIGHGIWTTDYPLQLYINKGSKTEYLYENPDTLKCNGEVIGATYPQIEFADFTGDGIRDLVLLDCFYNSQMGTDTTTLYFFKNSGTDSEPLFTSKEEFLHGGAKIGLKLGTLDAKDVNGDGGMDLVVTGTSKTIKIYYGEPIGSALLMGSSTKAHAALEVKSGVVQFGNRVQHYGVYSVSGRLLKSGGNVSHIPLTAIADRVLLLRWSSGGSTNFRKVIVR